MRIATIAILTGFLLLSTLVPAAAQPLTSYDTFDGPMLESLRWSGYEYVILSASRNSVPPGLFMNGPGVGGGGANSANNAEVRRGVADGILQLGLGTWMHHTQPDWDDTDGWGRMGLRIVDPPFADFGTIRAMQVTVTPRRLEAMSTCGGQPVAGAALVGVLFNDGSSTTASDATGDIVATLNIRSTVANRRTKIEARLWRCADESCSWIDRTPVASRDFDLIGTRGYPHVLAIRWDEVSRRVIFRATVKEQTERAIVRYTSPAAPARQFDYGVRIETHPGIQCGGPPPLPRHGMYFEAHFDDFQLASDAAE